METLKSQLDRLERELEGLYENQSHFETLESTSWTVFSLRAIRQTIPVYLARIAEVKERIAQEQERQTIPFSAELRQIIWSMIDDPYAREYLERLERIARAAHVYRQGPGSIYAYEELTEALAMVPILEEEAP